MRIRWRLGSVAQALLKPGPSEAQWHSCQSVQLCMKGDCCMCTASHLLPAGSLGPSASVAAAQAGDGARCAALAQHEQTGSLPDLLRLGMAAVKGNDGALIPHQRCQCCGLACQHQQKGSAPTIVAAEAVTSPAVARLVGSLTACRSASRVHFARLEWLKHSIFYLLMLGLQLVSIRQLRRSEWERKGPAVHGGGGV